MIKQIVGTVLCLCGLMAAPAALADWGDATDEPGPHFTGDLGLADGGDALVTFTYTNGSTKTLHAGESGYGDLGMTYTFAEDAFAQQDWSLQTTLGYSHASVDASNASVTFSYVPLDVIALYNYGNNHFGLGATYHINPTVGGAGLPQGRFDNALGWVLEYRYAFVGLRFTRIDYKVTGSGQNFNGDSYGAFVNFTF